MLSPSRGSSPLQCPAGAFSSSPDYSRNGRISCPQSTSLACLQSRGITTCNHPANIPCGSCRYSSLEFRSRQHSVCHRQNIVFSSIYASEFSYVFYPPRPRVVNNWASIPPPKTQGSSLVIKLSTIARPSFPDTGFRPALELQTPHPPQVFTFREGSPFHRHTSAKPHSLE